MQINIYNVELTSHLRSLLEEEHMFLYQFNVNILLLQCDIEKIRSNRSEYQVSLTLYLEDTTLIIVHKDQDLENGIDMAFLSLRDKINWRQTRVTYSYIKQAMKKFRMAMNRAILFS